MILFELYGSESAQPYINLAVSNGERHYSFLRSAVLTALETNSDFLSSQVIKAFNYHAIACLHTSPGEYRPCQVFVGDHKPVEHHRVEAVMDHFINQVNRIWTDTPPIVLAAYVLWRLNYIHPFINGNGRTARAASYFVLCLRFGQWLPGTTIMPELLRRDRDKYVHALQEIDKSAKDNNLNVDPLVIMMTELLREQLASAKTDVSDSSDDVTSPA